MTSARQSSSVVSARYAAALVELAEKAGTLDKVEKDLAELSAMIEDSEDLRLLIRVPLSNVGQQAAALQALADRAKFQDLTKNFIGMVVENRRLPALPSILETFRRDLAKHRGEISVRVETAQDLTAAQVKALRAALSKGMGADVTLEMVVEPSIIGGMIVTAGSRMIDDSVRRKLERLRGVMRQQANENNDNVSEVG